MRTLDYFRTMLRYSRRSVILLVLLMLTAGALEGISYTLFLPLIQIMTQGGDSQMRIAGFSLSFASALLLVACVFGLKNLSFFLQRRRSSELALKFERDLKQEIVDSTFASGWKFYLKEKIGDLTNAMAVQTRLAADCFKVMTLLAMEFLNVVVYCVIGLTLSVPAFLISVGCGALCFYLLRNVVVRSRRIGSEVVTIKNAVMSHVIEDFGGIKFIKGNHWEEQRKRAVRRMLDDARKTELRGETFAALMETLPDFLMACVICVILYVSYRTFRIPGENLLVLIMVLYRMNRRLISIQTLRQRLSLYLPSYEACRGILSRAEASREQNGSVRFERLKCGVEFKDVTFRYERHPVLHSVSIEVPRNRLTAIVGKSGSGKTTMLDLLMGLLKPDQGSVAVDGVDLGQYDVFSWRDRIGYVSQDIFLFNGTVEENIRMGSQASPEEFLEAARAAHVSEFADKLPQGYASPVGDRGMRLSGGQRQRIALARALLKNPELLILDEATSALDSESEKFVQDAVEALRGKMTILVVAHRMSTIERADMVYVLDGGHVKTSGLVDQLRTESALFKQIYNLR